MNTYFQLLPLIVVPSNGLPSLSVPIVIGSPYGLPSANNWISTLFGLNPSLLELSIQVLVIGNSSITSGVRLLVIFVPSISTEYPISVNPVVSS